MRNKRSVPAPALALTALLAASLTLTACTGAVEIFDKNPGCFINLRHPLKMRGESGADSFARWTAEDLDGNPVDQELLQGSKLTVVCAWSTFNCSAISDLTALQAIYGEYPREEVNVIGIVASAQEEDGSVSEGELQIVRQLEDITGAEFPQLLPSDDLIAIRLKDLDIVPETFLLDSAGNEVGEALVGIHDAGELRGMVERGLAILQQEDPS